MWSLEKVPEELKDEHKRWRLTRDKKPVDKEGRINRSPDGLMTYCEIMGHARDDFKPAVEFGEPLLCGIDLDGCRDPQTGKIDDWAREIVIRFGCYAEVSPSGTGVKLLFRDERANGGQPWNKRSMPGGRGGKRAGLEVYLGGTRYFVITGQRLKGMSGLTASEGALDWLLQEFAPEAPSALPAAEVAPNYDSVLRRAERYTEAIPGAQKGERDNGLWHIAVVGWRFGLEDDHIADLMRRWNQRCEPPEPNIDCRIKHKLGQLSKCSYTRGDLAAVPLTKIGEILEHDRLKFHIVRESDLIAGLKQKLEDGLYDLQTTGIDAIDEILGGGMPKNGVVAVMGRPSHGKTALILHCLYKLCRSGLIGLFVSKEMSLDELLARRIQSVTRAPRTEWRGQADAIYRRMQAQQDTDNLLLVDDCRDLASVEACIRHAVLTSDVNVVGVDYLQRIPVVGLDTEYGRVTQASLSLTNLAQELKVTMYLAVQMNRAKETTGGKRRAIMSDARGSGQIEQDVDLMLHVEWPHLDCPDVDEGIYRITILKSRFYQPTNPVVEIAWNHHTQEFEGGAVCMDLEEWLNAQEDKSQATLW